MIPPADANSFSNRDTSSDPDPFAFLQGSGEMGQLIRDFDWSRTSLGPVTNWPQSLRTSLSILLNAQLPMGLWWGEHLIQFYNDAYRPCLGNEGKHPEALGQQGSDCWPEVWPLQEPIIEQVLIGGQAVLKENQLLLIYRNGRTENAYWTFSYSPVRDESGRVAGVLVLCQDTTLQVEAMQLSKQRFLNFVRRATVGMIVLSGEEMVVEVVNDAYGRLIERSCEELLDKPLFSVIPEARPYFHPILEKVRTTGKPLYLYDYPYFVKVDGLPKEGFLDLVYQPYQESDGSITGVMVLCHDTTEKVIARKKVEESQERFQTMADNISQLVWIADGEGWIYWYNKRWYDYTGTSLEEMQGWGWEKVHHPDHLERVLSFVKSAWQQGEPWELEFPLRGQDGEYGWFLTRAVPIHTPDGSVAGWFGTNTDISEHQQTQQQLQTLNQELAATTEELRAANEEIQASNEELTEANRQLTLINADLDTFVYTASHDLKSPISNIEGLLKALERRLGKDAFQNPQIQQIYELLLSSVARFKSTIRDLSEVARAGKESPEDVATIALESILEEVQQDLGTQIEEAGAKLEIQLDCPAIHFSRKNLKSICYNLLSNALKYRSEQRQALMRIMCQSEGDYYVLCVEDNGLGIDMRQQDKIFALFKRLHAHVEGTGIGLYIVKKLVENAGGKIEVESQLGVGSTFKVYFKR
jgi:PAS domain S-box-containing protein